jgi:hypothetical protein
MALYPRMCKLIPVLALSTSAFAITSIYLWNELQDARRQIEAFGPVSATLRAPVAGVTQPQQDAAHAVQKPEMHSPDDAAKARQKMYEDDYRDSARQKLAQLSDPPMRAQILEEWKVANRSNKSKYARYLGISDADADRLIGVLAEQFLAQSEASARCTLQPTCDYQALSRDSNAARQLALTDLLGAEKQQRFEQYTYSNYERNMVSMFMRDKIPAGSEFSEDQTEQLIDALADERRHVETSIRQKGLEPFVYPMEGVVFTFQSSVWEPGGPTSA